MNVNEIRGYIFTAFALACFIGRSLGSAMMWGYYSDVYFTLIMIMAVGFGLIAAVCFAKAYNEIKYPGGTGKPEALKPNYRAGQVWTEFNMFQLRMDKVDVQQGADGYTCEALFTVENWRTELKSGGNQMRVKLQSEAEAGQNIIPLESTTGESYVDAAKHLQISHSMHVPEQVDRVLIKAVVTYDDGDAIYNAQFEFYPGHYTR